MTTGALRLVAAYIDCANAVLFGLSDVEFSRLQRIRNMTAKLVMEASKCDRSIQARYFLAYLMWNFPDFNALGT